MKNCIVVVTLITLCIATFAHAGSYNYVDPANFKKWLKSGKPVQIVDIQVPADFQKHHFKDALETNAYPVKSADDRKKLNKIIPQLADNQNDVVVVCPRGGGGAKNTYDYLKEKGIPEKRIFILEDGMQGWPYQQLTVGTGK
jgi:rhodanese-related sulfurtransferase